MSVESDSISRQRSLCQGCSLLVSPLLFWRPDVLGPRYSYSIARTLYTSFVTRSAFYGETETLQIRLGCWQGTWKLCSLGQVAGLFRRTGKHAVAFPFVAKTCPAGAIFIVEFRVSKCKVHRRELMLEVRIPAQHMRGNRNENGRPGYWNSRWGVGCPG